MVILPAALLRHLAQPARRTWMVLHAVWMAFRMMDRSPVASGWRFCSVSTKVVSVIAVESLQVRHGNRESRLSGGRLQASDSDSVGVIHSGIRRNLRPGPNTLAAKRPAAFCAEI
jgi:hypothetical protein